MRESYTVHVEILTSEGDWKDSVTRHFPIIPVAGDFIIFGFGTCEVIKRVVHMGTNEPLDAWITVRPVDHV